MDQKLLGIYLNDHLLGATAGIELVKRAAKNNSNNHFGDKLDALSAEIQSDEATLRKIMDDLGISEDVLKRAVAFVGERIGRLKLNGQLTGYSPLSRLVELEGLRIGIEGKLALWRSLKHVSDSLPLGIADLDELARRAEDQIDRVEAMRLEAAALALAAPEDTSSR